MYCSKCGTQNDDNAYKCTTCNQVLQRAADFRQQERIKNYLAESILVTLFCCLPLGIPAIVFAAQTNSKLQMGDIEGAMESSRKAKQFVWWSVGAGLAVGVIYMLFVMVAGAAQY